VQAHAAGCNWPPSPLRGIIAADPTHGVKIWLMNGVGRGCALSGRDLVAFVLAGVGLRTAAKCP
jgi:hypothetical protein